MKLINESKKGLNEADNDGFILSKVSFDSWKNGLKGKVENRKIASTICTIEAANFMQKL